MQHRHGIYRVVAFGWLQPSAGVWERWMVRQCMKCRALDPMQLIYVDPNFDLCASCLSQHLHPEDLDPRLMRCVDCGMLTPHGSTLTPEDLPNEVGEDDDDEDWKR